MINGIEDQLQINRNSLINPSFSNYNTEDIFFKYQGNNKDDLKRLERLVSFYNEYGKHREEKSIYNTFIYVDLSNNSNLSENIIELIKIIKIYIKEINLSNCNLTDLSKILSLLQNSKYLEKVILNDNNFESFSNIEPYRLDFNDLKENKFEIQLVNCKLKKIPTISSSSEIIKVINASKNPLNEIQNLNQLGCYNQIIYNSNKELLDLLIKRDYNNLKKINEDSYQYNFQVFNYNFELREFEKSNDNNELNKTIKNIQDFNECLQSLQEKKDNNLLDFRIEKSKENSSHSNIFDLSFEIKNPDQYLDVRYNIVNFLVLIIDSIKSYKENFILNITIDRIKFQEFQISEFDVELYNIFQKLCELDSLQRVNINRCNVQGPIFFKFFELFNKHLIEIDFSENSIEFEDNFFKLDSVSENNSNLDDEEHEEDRNQYNGQRILNLSRNKIANLFIINGNWTINLSKNNIKDFRIDFFIYLNKVFLKKQVENETNGPKIINNLILDDNEILRNYDNLKPETSITEIELELYGFLSRKIPEIRNISERLSSKSTKNLIIDFDVVSNDCIIHSIELRSQPQIIPQNFFELESLSRVKKITVKDCNFKGTLNIGNTKIKELNISNCQNLQEINVHVQLQHFCKLSIEKTPIENIHETRNINNLSIVNLNSISERFNYSIFSYLPNLEEIRIIGSNLRNLDFLEFIPRKSNIKILDFQNNTIESPIKFRDYINLIELNIDGNPIKTTKYLDTIPNDNVKLIVPHDLIKDSDERNLKKHFTKMNQPENQYIIYLQTILFNELRINNDLFSKYNDGLVLLCEKGKNNLNSNEIPDTLKDKLYFVRSDDIYNLLEDLSKIIEKINLPVKKRIKYDFEYRINIIIDSFLPCQYFINSCTSMNPNFNKDINQLILIYLLNNLNGYNLEFLALNDAPFTSLYYSIIGKFEYFVNREKWNSFINNFNSDNFEDCITVLKSIKIDIYNENNQLQKKKNEINLLIKVSEFYNHYKNGSFESIKDMNNELNKIISNISDSLTVIVGLNLDNVKTLANYISEINRKYYPFAMYAVATIPYSKLLKDSINVTPFYDLLIYRMTEMIFQKILKEKDINTEEKFTKSKLNIIRKSYKNFDDNFNKSFNAQFKDNNNKESKQDNDPNQDNNNKESKQDNDPNHAIRKSFEKINEVDDTGFLLELKHDIALCMSILPKLFCDSNMAFNVNEMFSIMIKRNDSVYAHGWNIKSILNSKRKGNIEKIKNSHKKMLQIYYDNFIKESTQYVPQDFENFMELFKIPKIELR